MNKPKEEKEVELKKELEFNHENEPNASVLAYAMQHLGYGNAVAICDIMDNSIDADATKIKLFIESDCIMIADNGTGMTEHTLNEALRLGSDVPRNNAYDLGKFGMGLSTASLSSANITTVLTKSAGNKKVLKSSTNMNQIQREKKFVKYLGKASPEEEQLFNNLLPGEKTGTIVILTECIGLKNKNVKLFTAEMTKKVARIYRKFMNKITFEVNGRVVQMYDPLFLDEPDTEKYSDEEYEVKWKDEKGQERKSKIRAKLVLVPDYGSDINRDKEINMKNQGFSVIRNGREIAFGYIPNGWIAKHNDLNRFRGELEFNAEMDEAMGVDFRKDGIDMVSSVKDKLAEEIRPQITKIKAKAKSKNIDKANKEVNHDLAAEAIDRKSHQLIKPKENTTLNSKKTIEESKENKVRPNVEFKTQHAGRLGAIFEAYQQGKTTVIIWNMDHPFYERFVVENRDNQTLVSSVDYLIYCLASAQIAAIGNDKKQEDIMNKIIMIMSCNMLTLLN